MKIFSSGIHSVNPNIPIDWFPMAGVFSNTVRLPHSSAPVLRSSGFSRRRPSTPLRPVPRRLRGLISRADPTDEAVVEPNVDTDDKSQATSVPQNTGFAEFPSKDINRRIALASVASAAGLFLTTRLEFGVSLKDLSAYAIPYEEALANGLPTVVEFYADWCEVCRELAPDVYKVEQQYKDRVNFVMLNVDNTKWEQELDEFGVEGIPHFAFLDKDGNEEGNVIGRLPRQYLLENVAALANGAPSIPHARVVGKYSSAEARKVHQVADPRSHG